MLLKHVNQQRIGSDFMKEFITTISAFLFIFVKFSITSIALDKHEFFLSFHLYYINKLMSMKY